MLFKVFEALVVFQFFRTISINEVAAMHIKTVMINRTVVRGAALCVVSFSCCRLFSLGEGEDVVGVVVGL